MDLVALFSDIREDRNVRESLEQVYRIVLERFREPLRSKIDDKLRARLDPEDILHEALIRAFTRLSTFRGTTEKEILGWIWRIARNLMIDQAKRRSVVGEPSGPRAAPRHVQASKLPARERRAESRVQQSDSVESLLGELDPREAEVIRLRWLDGRSFEEIAGMWGKTAIAVKRFYSRTWQRLGEIARRRDLSSRRH